MRKIDSFMIQCITTNFIITDDGVSKSNPEPATAIFFFCSKTHYITRSAIFQKSCCDEIVSATMAELSDQLRESLDNERLLPAEVVS